MQSPEATNPIESALQSVEGIQRAIADEALLQKIEARIQAKRAQRQLEQQRILRMSWQLAAAVVLLLVFNCIVWFQLGLPQLRMEHLEEFSQLYFSSSYNY